MSAVSSHSLPSLSDAERVRYSRHLRLPQIGEAGQRQLKSARVLLIGLGGLGSPAALYLAAAGIGTLGIAETDTVALHNLQRQVLFCESDVGRPKLEAGMAALQALNPLVKLVAHPEGLTTENALSLFSGYDIILDGTDNFPTRYLANDAAFLARRPLVHGSIFQFEGHATLFDTASGGPCYRCLFPEMPDPASVPTCEQAGVFGALVGVIGSLMAMEAIKLVTGAGEPLRGRLLIHDLLAGRVRTVQIPRNPDCPLCGQAPRITTIEAANYVFGGCNIGISGNGLPDMETFPLEITCEEAREWLAQPTPPLLLDVREDDEVGICKIGQARHIPMDTVPEHLTSLPKDTAIIVHCHHGGRSLRVTRFLRANGFAKVANLKGGIDRWAVACEPDMARY